MKDTAPDPKTPVPATSRRTFIRNTAMAAAAFHIVPGYVVGARGQTRPSNKLNIAAVGIGGMGKNNVKRCAETENIVALCDIDPNYAGKVFAAYPNAKRYVDYREMIDKQKDIDAIIIATPDHTHAAIAMEAMRAGKHVYVQKPLTYSVSEARLLTETARKYKVATQMGNQGHSGDGARMICEWVAAGAIGPIHEVHCFTNRPVWPQGVEVGRPTDTPPVPPGMDWNRWIGPAPMRPYHPAYHPNKWRAWCDFGTGSLGDMGCHIVDPVFWALKLKYPVSVEANISTYWEEMFKKVEPKNETFPRSSIVRFRFPEREGMPAVTMTWWDGGLMPTRPVDLEEGRKMGDEDGGALLIGEKGTIMCGCYGRGPRLIPESKMQSFTRPAPSIPRIEGGESGHEKDWIRACKGGPAASSNFDYSGPLAETVLMGNLAVRFPDRRLLWDGEKMQVTNDAAANEFVRRAYREGWSL